MNTLKEIKNIKNSFELHNLTHYLEIHDYLKKYEEYKDMDYENQAICCIKIYDNYIDNAINRDFYLIPDYFNDYNNTILNTIKKIIEGNL